MAKRRMFSADVVLTDKFTDMDSDAQALYFQLMMQADDDGLVASPKRLTKGCGFPLSALDALEKEGYLIFFPSGICVITHWHICNLIRKDRYKETVYLEEKARLIIKNNGEYVLSDEMVNKSDNFGNHLVASLETQESIGKERVDKVSIGKEREDKDAEKHPHGLYQNVFLTDTEFDTLQKEYPDYPDMIENLSRKIEMKGYVYQNHFVTLIEWAKEDAKRKDVPPAEPPSKYDYEAIQRASLERLMNRKFDPLPADSSDEFISSNE